VHAFDQPLILIAGGRSKGVPIDDLAATVAERVTAAVLIGETADEMATALGRAGLGRIERAGSMDEAVATASAIAREANAASGRVATVLLSPAAASFDMFRDYEARGAAFKSAVRSLVEGGSEAGGR
jgi:UDP-N-acetylmuramoylalanine--D-glutamate ligase